MNINIDTTINFSNIIKSITHVPDEEIEKLFMISHFKNVDKGYCFIREGDISRNFAFVINGLFRYYYLDEKGYELTKGFFLAEHRSLH